MSTTIKSTTIKSYVQEVAEDRGFKVKHGRFDNYLVIVVNHSQPLGHFAAKVLANAANMTTEEVIAFSKALESATISSSDPRAIVFKGIPFCTDVEKH